MLALAAALALGHVLFLAFFEGDASGIEDKFIGINGAAEADGHGQGVAGAAVDLDRLALAHADHFGVEHPVDEVADDDFLQVDVQDVEGVLEQVMSEGAIGLHILHGHRDGLRLEGPDDHRQAAVAVELAEYHGVVVGLAQAVRERHDTHFQLFHKRTIGCVRCNKNYAMNGS